MSSWSVCGVFRRLRTISPAELSESTGLAGLRGKLSKLNAGAVNWILATSSMPPGLLR